MSKSLSTILFTDPVTKLERDPAYYGVIPADLIGSDFNFGWTSWQQGRSYSSNLEKVLTKVEGWSEKQKLGDEKVGIDYREWLYQLETLLYDLPGAFDIIKNPQSELRKLLATHELLTGIDLRLRKVVYETFSDNLKRRLYMDKKLNKKADWQDHVASGLFRYANQNCGVMSKIREQKEINKRLDKFKVRPGEGVNQVIDRMMHQLIGLQRLGYTLSPSAIYFRLHQTLSNDYCLEELMQRYEIPDKKLNDPTFTMEDLMENVRRVRAAAFSRKLKFGQNDLN